MNFTVKLTYNIQTEHDAIVIQSEILDYVNKGLTVMETELWPEKGNK